MKITLVNFLFLVIFALAASSTPVRPFQAHAPITPSTRHTSETGEVTFMIGGRRYTYDRIEYELTLLDLRKRRGIEMQDIVETEMLAFEGTLLDLKHELETVHYNEIRSQVHRFMVFLIDSLLPGTLLHTNHATVQSIARNALKTCLEWETTNEHTDDLPIVTAGAPLESLQYLKALKDKLEALHGA